MVIDPGTPIVILTGAGISAESGIRTFRDSQGLWEEHAIEDVATPEGFHRNPELVHRFYNQRRAQLAQVTPNAAHVALAELERFWPGPVLLVTQNVDDLHDRAGSRNLIHMHGELLKVRCTACHYVLDWPGDTGTDSHCPHCASTGSLRPHIVWFGEMPLEMDTIYEALEQCGLFLSIGTSGQVYPAAGFVQAVREGAHTIHLNMETSGGLFQEERLGPASQTVPELVEALRANVPVAP